MGFLCPNQFINTITNQYNELCLFAAKEVQALLRHEPAAKAVFILQTNTERNITSEKGAFIQ